MGVGSVQGACSARNSFDVIMRRAVSLQQTGHTHAHGPKDLQPHNLLQTIVPIHLSVTIPSMNV
jgi:hypothetical protein